MNIDETLLRKHLDVTKYATDWSQERHNKVPDKDRKQCLPTASRG